MAKNFTAKLDRHEQPSFATHSGLKLTLPSKRVMYAPDAVDGAHSAASECHRVVASKRTT